LHSQDKFYVAKYNEEYMRTYKYNHNHPRYKHVKDKAITTSLVIYI